MAAAQQGADVIVAPDIEHDVLGPVIAPFFLQHPAVGLIDSKSAHTEVPDRLAQVGRQILLPSLAVTNLVAMSEAVAIGVNAASLACIHMGRAGAVGLDSGNRCAAVDPIRGKIISQDIAHFRIKARPTGTAQESVNHFP